MENLIVTSIVCIILGTSYTFFNKDAKKRKIADYNKKVILRTFYKNEIENMKTLPLEGVGNDGNNDFAFIQAVKKINLTNDIRIQIYD